MLHLMVSVMQERHISDICLPGLPADRIPAYMDDIVIFSFTFAEHISSLESVFQRLRSAGVTLRTFDLNRSTQ